MIDEEYRTQQRAHGIVAQAVKAGRLIRPSACSSCGRECEPQGHHSDYTIPLEVVWLCRSCHRKRHGRSFGPAHSSAGDHEGADCPECERVKIFRRRVMIHYAPDAEPICGSYGKLVISDIWGFITR